LEQGANFCVVASSTKVHINKITN